MFKDIGSIIDFPHSSLDPDIFKFDTEKGSYVLREDVATQICEWILEIVGSLDVVKGIYIIGSITTLHYSSESDIDVTVVVDEENLSTFRKIALQVNGKKFLASHPVNFYFRSDAHLTGNAYDVLGDYWVNYEEDVRDLPEERFESIWKDTQLFIHQIDVDIGELSRDVRDVMRIEEYIKSLDLTDDLRKKLEDKLNERINEIEEDIAQLLDIYTLKHEERKKWFEREDASGGLEILYGEPNVVWKYLERYKYIQFLTALKKASEEAEEKGSVEPISDLLEDTNLFLENRQ